ncbi:hypothetical protein [Sneathiella sp.]|uniref:hypothetical protein n=1 Tax=Sneathiella sp. TaxID=1964365 RepID=UPI003564AC61
MIFTNFQLWQQGTMLQDAWKLPCDDVVRKRIEEIGLEVLETLGQSPQMRTIDQLFSLFDRNNSKQSMGQLLDLLNEEREEIIVELYNDELVGIGQTVLHSSSRRYDLIQSEFWYDADADWKSCSARTIDREYVRIRVIDPYKYPQFAEKKGRGRPGVRDKLFEALDYINEHKVLDIQTGSHKEVIIEILNYFKLIKPNDYKDIESLEFSTFRKNITLYRNR